MSSRSRLRALAAGPAASRAADAASSPRPLPDPSRFVLVSEWETQEALDADYRSQAFADFQLGLDGLLARPSESTVYSAEGAVRPLNTRVSRSLCLPGLGYASSSIARRLRARQRGQYGGVIDIGRGVSTRPHSGHLRPVPGCMRSREWVGPDGVSVGGQFGPGVDNAFLHCFGSVHFARLVPRSHQPGDSAVASRGLAVPRHG
jgi:hypothetical protein